MLTSSGVCVSFYRIVNVEKKKTCVILALKLHIKHLLMTFEARLMVRPGGSLHHFETFRLLCSG